MQRREFLGLAAGVAALPSWPHTGRARTGSADVVGWRRQLDDFEVLENRFGGGGVFDLNVAAAAQLRQIRESGTFTESAARELDRLIAQAGAQAGWAAYDSDRHEIARAWWMEGLHAADLAGDDDIPTRIYAELSLQAVDQGRGREAVALAQRALKAAAALPPSPRLRSLLHAREAEGYAAAGDTRLAWRTFAKLDDPASAAPRDEDPPWLAFWGAADLAAHRATASRAANDVGGYESAARDALHAADGAHQPRNLTSYQAYLADALVRRDALDEAVPLLGQALAQSTAAHSARVRRRLDGTLRLLEPHRASRPVADLLDWAAEITPRG